MSFVSMQAADALVELLNNHFSATFTAVRLDDPTFDAQDVETVTVAVVAREEEEETATRTTVSVAITVDVAILQHVTVAEGSTIEAACEPLKNLVQSMREYVRFKNLGSVGANGASWMKTANKPLLDPVQLREKRIFFSLLSITYELLG